MNRFIKLIAIIVICIPALAFNSETPTPYKAMETGSIATPPPYKFDIDSLVKNASLREKIGQLFVVRAYGRFTNKDTHTYKELTDLVTKHKVGGFIFMQGQIYDQAILTNKLQRLSNIPLWITQDMEYGAAMRVSGTTRITPAMGVASSGDKFNAYLAGQVTAREAKALGVHQIFAPVLDVNNNPLNPVINVRSYSADPHIVAEFGTAFIKGVQSEGLVATAKHFPGHGDTDTDSHIGLPVLDFDYNRLDSLELIPFKAAIDNGITSIMSAHIAFPQISSEKDLPGTLDEVILGDILADSLKFDGLVVTDGLEMQGITSKYSPGRAVVRALKAGADIMLISPDVYTAINEVEQAVLNGEITEERINQSYRKLLLWKQEFGLFDGENIVDIDKIDEVISSHEHDAIARKIAKESVTVLKNQSDILPIDPTRFKNIMVLSISDGVTGTTGNGFASAVRDFHPNVNFFAFDERTTNKEKDQILRKAKQVDLIIIGAFIRLSTGNSIQFSRDQLTFLRRVLKGNKKSALVAFGNPYTVSELSDTDVHIMGWYNSSNQMNAVAAAMFGAADVGGKLTIEIPGMYQIGDGLEFPHTVMGFGDPEDVGVDSRKLYEIEDILRDAVRDSVFPGAVAAVVKDGKMIYREAVGYHDYEKLKAVKKSDVFDLASITKVMSTTTAVMKLINDEKIELSNKVSEFIPEFDTDVKKDITIGQLLLHESGLPPFRVYVDSLKTRKEIIEAIKNEPLTYEPGTEYVYSDLGMILLAEIVGEITGQRIDGFMRKEFFYPMGMSATYFNPKKVSRWYVNRIPPTEIDDTYHRGLVQGMVHDERAYFMDGVAGHAGLFSNAVDMGRFSTMLLNGGVYGTEQYISPQIINLFTSEQSELSGRGYGFDRRSESGFTTAGQLSSNDTFGHLGFTGTSLWIDREKNMAVILLTNRTFPSRDYGKRISRIRAAVADAAYSAIKEKL
ncbi:glycoside hydrolase family 3 N-terminal domain-containing protein [Balneola vulgaris]|uniref:glycoside hydrolase family 3 N-terminal domain-containing protein n=1 Tax=Balneola vulgaris TaxID=287535 RepID=UPI000375FD3E|nr:glycoside hydrolase family 3 N-terminal domain-containing protein [Balneola vulgaris]